jgi:flagellin-like protein
MKSRRAISPVIATVILIAVAVALGIAVAVWAGALTGSLQKSEKLTIYAYESGTNLVLSITNNSPGSATVTTILFNSQPLTTVAADFNSGFSVVTAGTGLPATLLTNTVGVVTVPNTAFTANSGITYPISVVTAAGNTYPVTITWS